MLRNIQIRKLGSKARLRAFLIVYLMERLTERISLPESPSFLSEFLLFFTVVSISRFSFGPANNKRIRNIVIINRHIKLLSNCTPNTKQVETKELEMKRSKNER